MRTKYQLLRSVTLSPSQREEELQSIVHNIQSIKKRQYLIATNTNILRILPKQSIDYRYLRRTVDLHQSMLFDITQKNTVTIFKFALAFVGHLGIANIDVSITGVISTVAISNNDLRPPYEFECTRAWLMRKELKQIIPMYYIVFIVAIIQLSILACVCRIK